MSSLRRENGGICLWLPGTLGTLYKNPHMDSGGRAIQMYKMRLHWPMAYTIKKAWPLEIMYILP